MRESIKFHILRKVINISITCYLEILDKQDRLTLKHETLDFTEHQYCQIKFDYRHTEVDVCF